MSIYIAGRPSATGVWVRANCSFRPSSAVILVIEVPPSPS
jgi:hypothetical protein